MAIKESGCSYSREVKNLKSSLPLNLYLLYGEEDYLRESYYSLLLSICIPEGESSFSYKRFEGPELNISALSDALDQMPFITDKTFVHIKDVDINHIKESDNLISVLKNIPDYCVVCFEQNSQYSLDGRTKLVKYLKERGKALYFTHQDSYDLKRWVSKRFSALNKTISSDAADRLIFVSGDLMNRLIPEIEKIAAYSTGSEVTVEDVNAVEGKPAVDSDKLLKMGTFTALAIAIHNFPEGIATFMSALQDPNLGIAIAIAVAIHNVPEGIAVAVPIFYATGNRMKAFKLSLLSGLAEPVGAIVAFLILMPFLNDVMFGVVFAGVAGIMVFISLDELLPAAKKYDETHLSIYGLVAGMAVMAISLVLLV